MTGCPGPLRTAGISALPLNPTRYREETNPAWHQRIRVNVQTRCDLKVGLVDVIQCALVGRFLEAADEAWDVLLGAVLALDFVSRQVLRGQGMRVRLVGADSGLLETFMTTG